MPKRYRFYTWDSAETTFAKLRSRLILASYSEDTGQGFHLSRSNRQLVEGRFVQRITYTEELVSPDGSITATERIGYVHTAFRMRPLECGIVLIDPPRSLSAFLHNISYLLDYELSTQPVTLNLAKLKRSLDRLIGKARVTSVKISGAELSKNAVADITVTDTQDALESAIYLFPEHRKLMGKIDMAFGGEAGGLRISASRSGSITATNERDSLLEHVWDAVAASKE